MGINVDCIAKMAKEGEQLLFYEVFSGAERLISPMHCSFLTGRVKRDAKKLQISVRTCDCLSDRDAGCLKTVFQFSQG